MKNPLRSAWQKVKGWGSSPPTSNSLLQVLQGIAATDGEHDALADVVRVATLYRAVQRIASDLASVPLLIERKTGKAKWEPLDEDDLSFGGVAGVFQRANPDEGKTALWHRFHQSAELTGRAYLLTDYTNFGQPVLAGTEGGRPKLLRVLRVDCTEAIFDNARTRPIGYRYTPPGGTVRNLRLDEVLDYRYPHPREEWCGLAPARAVQIYTKIEDTLARYQRTFIDQGARGSVLLSLETVVTEEQSAQLRREWNATNSGHRNVGGVWITGRGMKAQELNGRRDTDFVDLFRIVKEQVSMAFGVPPAFLSDYSRATLANIDEQTPIYVEGTLMPKGALLTEALTEGVLPRFDVRGTLRARLDWDKLPMVQRMNVAKMTSYATLVDKVLTREEVRLDLGREAKPEFGEFTPPLDPFAFAPLPGEAPPKKPAEKPKEEKSLRLLAPRKWIDDPVRHAKRATVATSIEAHMTSAVRQFRAYFRDVQERMLDALPGAEKAFKDVRPDELYDEVAELEIVRGIVARIYTRIYGSRGAQAMEEAGIEGSSFNLDDPRVRAFIEQNAYRNGTRIVGTTADKLRALLIEVGAEGLTIQEIASEIQDLCGEMRRGHAVTIARTETIRAYNASSLEGWRQTGVVEKVGWLTAQDDAVRDSHAAIDGETVTLGATFSNGLQFPGDPSGPPEETINCFIPSTEVSGAFVGGLRARYAGPVREIETARGHRLTLTPNHPVLTSKGWTPARLLEQGDEVISYGVEAGLGVEGDVDHDQRPARIKDVFEALAVDRGLTPAVVTALDLHGDAARAHKQIDVVRTDGVLLDGGKAAGPEHGREVVLVEPTAGEPVLHRAGTRDLDVEWVALPTASNPRALALSTDTSGVALETAPLQPLRVGLAAHLDASRYEPAQHDLPPESCFVRQLLERGAGLVATDQIRQVRDLHFDGHVYDLQSVGGWIVAGGIVCSNCRCTLEPLTDDSTRTVVAHGFVDRLFARKGLTAKEPAGHPLPSVNGKGAHV